MSGLPRIVRTLAAEPDRKATVTMPHLVVGRFLCRDVRSILYSAALDVEVVWQEERGWLESVFVIRMSGRARLVRRHLLPLLALAEADQ